MARENFVGDLQPVGPSTIRRPAKQPITTNCIFCKGAPTNWEHVWPRWSHRFIPKQLTKWESLHATEHMDRSEFEIRKYAGDPHDLQVKCVDEKCNNGWMRKQEDKFRPLFIRMLKATPDEPIRLTEKDQLTIATWLAVKAIVQEYAPEGSRLTHHMQRHRFWKHGVLPESAWRMWIGNYEGSTSRALWVSYPFQLLPGRVAAKRKTNTVAHYNSQVASYVIGKLFILLLRSPGDLFVRMWRNPDAGGDLRQIWPPLGYSFSWPPRSLTDDEALAATWNIRSFLARNARKRTAGSRIPSLGG